MTIRWQAGAMTGPNPAPPATATEAVAASRARARLGRPTVVVVGGGISGLTVAWRLRELAQVVVLEQGEVCGGLLRAGTLAGIDLDLGAESVLARRPEAVALMHEIGLAEEIVHPVTHAAQVLCDGVLQPLPPATVLGVPSSSSGLEAVLGAEGAARVAAEDRLPPLPPEGEDVDRSVAAWVGERVGVRVVQRLVEPLLGGVYAGRSDYLSAQACLPALWQAAHAHGGLLAGAAALTRASAGDPRPVFAGLVGGLGVFAERLAAAVTAAGVRVRTGAGVSAVLRQGDGSWRVRTGPEEIPADAVVLAVPAPAAAALLAPVSRAAAGELDGVETASVALLAAVVPRSELAGLAGSGVLVPPVEGAPGQGGHLLVGQVGLGGPAVRRACRGAVLGRATRERAVLHARRREPSGTWSCGRPPVILGRGCTRSATRWSAGAARCRSTTVGHLDRVAPRCARPRPRCPGSRCAARLMTGWASRRASAPRDRAAAESARRSGQAALAWPGECRSGPSSERTGDNGPMSQPARNADSQPARSTTPSATRCGRCSPCATGCRRRPRRAGRRGRRPARPAGGQGRGRARLLRRLRAARRRRLHGLVARPSRRDRCRRPTTGCRRTALGRSLRPVWSNVGAAPAGRVQQGPHPGVHGRRGAARLPLRVPVRALLRLVPAARRGAPGTCWPSTAWRPASYPDVRANTVPAFALGDYEWMLAFEADELHRIVDLMRDLRATEARRHVREEIPFYTGPRIAARRAGRTAALTSGRCMRRSAGSSGAVRPGVGAWARADADRVDAVALVGRGAVALALEHVPEVRAAAGAAHLDALHARCCGPRCTRRVVGQRGEERRPAAVASRTCRAAEQLGAAGPAAVDALGVVSQYSPVKARSVPAWRSTWYSEAVSLSRQAPRR